LFRRKHKNSDGRVAVPVEQLDEWAHLVIDAASEKATSDPVPPYVDVLGRVTLHDVCGRERAAAMQQSAGLFAYNLFLLGYWSRAEDLRIQKQPEASRYLGTWMTGAREQFDTWFVTIQWATHALADDQDIRHRLAEFIAPGAGDDFRRRLATLGIARMAHAIDERHPGTSAMLTPEEKVRCWTLGYWMRVVSSALSPEADAELAAECAES
jgi:hypothetical protein